MTQSFSDDFNRADGALGSNWTSITSGLEIASNAAKSTASGALSVWVTACDTDDNSSKATISAKGTSTSLGVVARSLNSAATCYLWRSTAAGVYQLFKSVSGTLTALGSSYSGSLVDGVTIEITASGSTITGFLNTTQRQQVTDTSIASGKYVGLRLNTDTTTRMDDWSGGDLTSGATALTVAGATHAQTADNVTLTQHNVLVIQNATHAHSANNLSLSGTVLLSIQSATHAHTAGNVTLTANAIALAIGNGVHAHTAGNVDLVQHNILSIQWAGHAHTASNVTLYLPGLDTWWEWDGGQLVPLTLVGEWNGSSVDPLTYVGITT